MELALREIAVRTSSNRSRPGGHPVAALMASWSMRDSVSEPRPLGSARARQTLTRLMLAFCVLPCLGAQDADLMTTVWDGVQRAQKEFTSGCGKIVETRTSLLLARPMVFRGKFCAAGMDRFALEYTEPEPVRILFNKDYLNVTT